MSNSRTNILKIWTNFFRLNKLCFRLLFFVKKINYKFMFLYIEMYFFKQFLETFTKMLVSYNNYWNENDWLKVET